MSIKKIIVHWMPADKPSKASCVEGTTKAALGRPVREQIKRAIKESAVMLKNKRTITYHNAGCWCEFRLSKGQNANNREMTIRLQWPSLHNLKLWPRDFFITNRDGHVVQLTGERIHRANITGGGEERGGDSLGFGLGICDLANEYGVLRVTDVALLLHVRGGDRKHGSIIVEGQRGDAGGISMELTQALLVERIPDVDKAIWTTW